MCPCQVVADGKAFTKAQSAAHAAVKDGLKQADLRDLASIGGNGKSTGNAARDFAGLSSVAWAQICWSRM